MLHFGNWRISKDKIIFDGIIIIISIRRWNYYFYNWSIKLLGYQILKNTWRNTVALSIFWKNEHDRYMQLMPLCYRNSCKSNIRNKKKKHARADQLFFPSFQPVLVLLRAKKGKTRCLLREWEGKHRSTRERKYIYGLRIEKFCGKNIVYV